MTKVKRARVQDVEDEYYAEPIDIEADFAYDGKEEPTGEYL